MAVVKFDDTHWRYFIKTVDKKIKDPRPLLKAAFLTEGFRDVINHFQEEKGPEGKWKPSKRVIKEGGQTLQDTGNLRQNFLPSNIESKGKSIVFFNPTPYAAVHDRGSSKKGIPKREFMFLSDRAQERMTKVILDQLVK